MTFLYIYIRRYFRAPDNWVPDLTRCKDCRVNACRFFDSSKASFGWLLWWLFVIKYNYNDVNDKITDQELVELILAFAWRFCSLQTKLKYRRQMSLPVSKWAYKYVFFYLAFLEFYTKLAKRNLLVKMRIEDCGYVESCKSCNWSIEFLFLLLRIPFCLFPREKSVHDITRYPIRGRTFSPKKRCIYCRNLLKFHNFITFSKFRFLS